MDPLDQLKAIISEIEQATTNDAAELEAFRIKYLGSKNVLKPLSALIRDVPNQQKREFGLLVNEAKNKAEAIFQQEQDRLQGGSTSSIGGARLKSPGITTTCR